MVIRFFVLAHRSLLEWLHYIVQRLQGADREFFEGHGGYSYALPEIITRRLECLSSCRSKQKKPLSGAFL